MKLRPILFAIGFLGLGVTPSSASVVSWGSAIGDDLFTSYGSVLDDNFIFELGTFGSFVPTLANSDQWVTNWKLFDRAVAPGVDGWNSSLGFVSSEASITASYTSDSPYASSGTTFSAGEQAYIWVYNSLTLEQGTEWALVTNDGTDGNAADNWTMPEPDCCGGNSEQFRLSNATSVPLGGLNDYRGPGTFSDKPASYQLQTSAIPEPSSSLLIATVGFTALLRRHRRRQ